MKSKAIGSTRFAREWPSAHGVWEGGKKLCARQEVGVWQEEGFAARGIDKPAFRPFLTIFAWR